MSLPFEPLRWGILSTGRIAGIFARGLADSQYGELRAVGSRSLESAEAFVKEHGGSEVRAHGSYEALLADPEVEAVYIATPHPQHAEWAVRAAEAGKHILCEKPLGLNHAEAMVVIQAARENKVVLMEAFMYRCHPQTAKLVELIREGAIGRVGLIQATFGFGSEFNPDSRVWANAAGGGGILDVGCYPVSMARLLAGAVSDKTFLDPEEVSGAAELHPETGVDAWATASLKFNNGVVASLSTSVGLQLENVVRIYGDAGWIFVPAPWQPPAEGSKILVHRSGQKETEEIEIKGGSLYGLEADVFAKAVREGLRDVPQISTADTLGNMATLDRWRTAVGLTYEAEKPEAFTHTIARRPLKKRPDAPMIYAEVPGIKLPVARFVMGCDNQKTMPHAAAMWDDYFERGGNIFDSAYVYGGGLQERLLGQWIKNRGLREQVVVLGKGAHTPFCTPKDLSRQLEESLDRLQTEWVDIYLLHRDNPDIPVEEFVEVLNQHVAAGQIKVFGGSNWSLERVEAANAYAAKNQLQGFGAISNNFSLAQMMDPVWAGCVSSSDAESRKWLQKTQIPIFAWSSQARGFFTDRAGKDLLEDEELVRCWYSEENFARRERVLELAKQKNVSAPAIAAAYVLAQPFPTFALIGPRQISETADSFESLKVQLSAEECEWLNSGVR